MINKVILVGNVGKEPEIKTVGNDKKVAKFSLATSEQKDKTTWHQVVVWDKLAELVEKYVNKGSKLYLEGRIDYREHEGKYYTSIVCFSMKFLDSKGESAPTQTQPPAPSEGTDESDILPF